MKGTTRALVFGLLGALLGMAASAPAHAGLTGVTMSAGYYYPNEATIYPFASVPPDFVVGPGLEASIDVENVTDIDFDFGDLSLLTAFSTSLTSPTWNAVDFNGVIFTSATPLDISSAHVVSTTMAGFDDSRVIITADQIKLNWQGLSYVSGTEIRIVFDGVPVPEPTGWALLIASLGIAALAVPRGRTTPRKATRLDA